MIEFKVFKNHMSSDEAVKRLNTISALLPQKFLK